DRQAAAEEISVPVGVIDAADDRPEFVFPGPGRRIGRRFTAIAMLPVFNEQILCGMRRPFERVILSVGLTGLDRADLTVNGYHRIAEAVQFGFGLALSRFDHHGSRNGPGHRRSVKSVVDKSFCNVLNLDASRFLEWAQ